jgi:hypothetical protein
MFLPTAILDENKAPLATDSAVPVDVISTTAVPSTERMPLILS